MQTIGILSDTHGFLHPKIVNFFSPCDQIWHAGDIGDIAVIEQLEKLKPIQAVVGNIDGGMLRKIYKDYIRFDCEGVNVLLTHIGGYPGKYDPFIKRILFENPPQLFVCGHSHILKVIFDDKINCLHINPGASGRSGFHQVITAVRLQIEGKEMKNLEIIELPKFDKEE